MLSLVVPICHDCLVVVTTLGCDFLGGEADLAGSKLLPAKKLAARSGKTSTPSLNFE